MKHIFYEDFAKLLDEYKNATSRDEKIIKHSLDSIVSLYDACELKERDFADRITLEFSIIITLLKNQHKKAMLEVLQKYEDLKKQCENQQSTCSPIVKSENESSFEYDYEVLGAFYDYFKGDAPLSYWEIEGYKFNSNDERKKLVNLTIFDYVNRIKTFANKYLHEIYPDDVIPRVIHPDSFDEFDTFEPIVFIYNNLELIIAKFKTTNDNGDTIKQRLNIRSALRKLNDFKQTIMEAGQSNIDNYIATSNPLANADIFITDKSIAETYIYYLMNHAKKSYSGVDVRNACAPLRTLWAFFYESYKNGELPQELNEVLDVNQVERGTLNELLLIYNYSSELIAYVSMMLSSTNGSKIWKDFQDALDSFNEFVNYVEK